MKNNPLGLTYEQGVKLRDAGHISQALFNRAFPQKMADGGSPAGGSTSNQTPDFSQIPGVQQTPVYQPPGQPGTPININVGTAPTAQQQTQTQPQSPPAAPLEVNQDGFADDADHRVAARQAYQDYKDAVAAKEQASDQKAKDDAEQNKASLQQDIDNKTAQAKQAGYTDDQINQALAPQKAQLASLDQPTNSQDGIQTADIKPGQPTGGKVTLASDLQPSTRQSSFNDIMQQYGPDASGINMMEQGIRAAANTGVAKASEESAYLSKMQDEDKKKVDQQAQQQAQRADFENKMMSNLQTKVDDIANQTIDPNHYWSNKSTGDKLIAGIAVGLGALGGSNIGYKVMTNAIDNDINAQKAAIQNKKDAYTAQSGLYQHMLNTFKDRDLAEEATRVAYLNNAQIGVKQIAAKYSGADAQAKATQLIGELEQKKIDAQQAFKMNLMKMMPVGPNANVSLLDPEQRERMVPGYGLANTKDQAKDMNEAVSQAKLVTDGINKLQNILDTKGKSLSPEMRGQAQALSKSLIGPLKTLIFGSGARLNETEIGIIEDIARDPTKLTNLDSVTKSSLQTILDRANKALAYKAEQAGLISPEKRLGIASR